MKLGVNWLKLHFFKIFFFFKFQLRVDLGLEQEIGLMEDNIVSIDALVPTKRRDNIWTNNNHSLCYQTSVQSQGNVSWFIRWHTEAYTKWPLCWRGFRITNMLINWSH